MEICFWALTAIYHPTLKARNRVANGEWAFADADSVSPGLLGRCDAEASQQPSVAPSAGSLVG